MTGAFDKIKMIRKVLKIWKLMIQKDEFAGGPCVKPAVDPLRCIGCGLCVQLCPSLFELRPEMIAVAVAVAEDEALVERLEATIDYCPVQAISQTL